MSKFDTAAKPASAQLAALRLDLTQEVQNRRQAQPHQSKRTKSPSSAKVKTPDNPSSQAVELDAVSVAFTLLNGWTQNNAGQVVYELAEQSLMGFAKKRPFQLIGISFVFGLAIVLSKPWRRLPRGLPATLGSLAAVKLYQSLMSALSKKP